MTGSGEKVGWQEPLETIKGCPVCSSSDHSILYKELTDENFRVAPGKWTLLQCRRCGTAYINPRPTEQSIALAYSSYYTHERETDPPPETIWQRVRKKLADDFRNREFGTDRPALPFGLFIGKLVPALANRINFEFRFAKLGQGQTLLDVGCGAGTFLELMRSAGWSVAGVEPDPRAQARLREDGIEVLPTIDEWLAGGKMFDFVTLNHVIEHIHNPRDMLTKVFSVLNSGGTMFIETPNVDSAGHKSLRDEWLHLDPPRHLVLFNPSSLKETLIDVGFKEIRPHSRSVPICGIKNKVLSKNKSKSEFVCFTAEKP